MTQIKKKLFKKKKGKKSYVPISTSQKIFYVLSFRPHFFRKFFIF